MSTASFMAPHEVSMPSCKPRAGVGRPKPWAPADVKPRPTEAENLRVREKYQQRRMERMIDMYRQAYELVLEREAKGSQKMIQFAVPYQTSFGQDVFIVGSCDVMGKWDVSKALPLQWTDGNIWKTKVTITDVKTPIEYKYIVKQGSSVTWEPGANHKISLASGKTTFDDKWGAGGIA